MAYLSQLLVTAVLATTEICAEPMEGSVGAPLLCRLAESQEISTPYFSIVVEADFFVGVDREGRRLLLQSMQFNNQAVLAIEVLDGSTLPEWPRCGTVEEFVIETVKWQDCRFTDDGVYERWLAASLKERHVLIQYLYSPEGTKFAPALERMTQTIKVHAI
jgi:hypothetical protein